MSLRILGLDLETTGLEVGTHKIIEMAFVLKEVGVDRPLLQESHLVWEEDYKPPSLNIQELTGISSSMLTEFGMKFEYVCKRLNSILRHEVDFILAHNGENFDKPFLLHQMKTHDLFDLKRIVDAEWVDSAHDVEYPFQTKKLKYLAAEYGISTSHSHMALFDVITMLEIFELQDIDKAIERSKSLWITIRALVDFENKSRAKKARFMWEAAGEKLYSKCWVKRIKECDFEKEKEGADFEIVRID